VIFEKEQLELRADLVESLLTVIPAKKIILLKDFLKLFSNFSDNDSSSYC